MTFLDIIIVVSLLTGFYIGWKLRGFHLLGIILSLVIGIPAANHFHPYLHRFFQHYPAAVGVTLAWLTIFLFIALLIAVASGILSRLFETIELKWLDQLLGAVLATAMVLLLLLVGLNLFAELSRFYHWKIIERSFFSPTLLKSSRPWIQRHLDQYPQLKKSVQ